MDDKHSDAGLKIPRIIILLLAFLAAPHLSLSQTVAADKSRVPEPAASTQTPDGAIQVRLRLTETVSSANAWVGQPISFEVIDPVQVGGKLVVAAGAHARGTVSVARRRGHNRREGKLLLTIQSVSRVDGTEALLRSSLNKGSGVGPGIFGPCTFPIPADPVGLFRKGVDVVIPKGTELVATLTSDTP